MVLAAQILWSEDVDAALTSGGGDGLKRVLAHVENMLNILADSVLQEQPPLRRRKLEHLVSSYTICIMIFHHFWTSQYPTG